MEKTTKRTRPKKTDLEKKMEKAIRLGKAWNIHAIKTAEFEIVFTPTIITNQPPKSETKPKPSVNAAGIEINGEIPKEEIHNEEDMLFWSTPTYGLEKKLMNGEALEKTNQ